ncbi:hypothetical protein B0H67DRAFT_611875 [Lasiosphaeris hirsuta]|uniref:Uncharacterized protein n=1 Tax=Lasiosphaeris hirsuta TaxID=260670 RepID=A0AA40A9U6_9PEZI|nr:hypothetical protein B0H67DRAFT_611875 [Lasiosphaeris hirsuta]
MGVVVYFTLSTVFHTFSDHSPHMRKFGNGLYHPGIVLVMWGTAVSGAHFAFYYQPAVRNTYIVLLTATVAGCGSGVSLFTPIAHGLIRVGWVVLDDMMGLQSFFRLGLINFSGSLVYATRIPERWFLRTFDLLEQSHNWMTWDKGRLGFTFTITVHEQHRSRTKPSTNYTIHKTTYTISIMNGDKKASFLKAYAATIQQNDGQHPQETEYYINWELLRPKSPRVIKNIAPDDQFLDDPETSVEDTASRASETLAAKTGGGFAPSDSPDLTPCPAPHPPKREDRLGEASQSTYHKRQVSDSDKTDSDKREAVAEEVPENNELLLKHLIERLFPEFALTHSFKVERVR